MDQLPTIFDILIVAFFLSSFPSRWRPGHIAALAQEPARLDAFSPKSALGHGDDPKVLILEALGRLDQSPQPLGRLLAGGLVTRGALAEYLSQGLLQANETYKIRVPLCFVGAPLEDGHGRLDPGVLEPRFVHALQDGDELVVL